jgi:predicted NUDIX family NTP pyrophosphohydrolase
MIDPLTLVKVRSTVCRQEAAMSKKSAGLLLFREAVAGLEVLLVHPGGPFWARKDDGSWSIPKGEFADDEEPLAAAKREFEEEMGTPPAGDFIPLDPVRQPSGKLVLAWAVRSDFDPSSLKSNTFSMEWPPKSGQQQAFPEVDRAAWFNVESARPKILKGQAPFLDQLLDRIDSAEGYVRTPAARGSGPAATRTQAAQQSLFGDES